VTVIYAAALAALPPEPIAAAAVDGATAWQSFRYVVWPMLMPITVLIGMFRLIDALLTLDVVFTTTFGGPGFATHTVTFWIYQQALRYFNIGYAAAASWLLLIACMLVAAVFLLWRARVSRWIVS
jgi:ABC-type sugar transport system permease subunit